MIIYKDVITGDELFSDAFKFEEVDDVFYRLKGKLTTETTDMSGVNIGANASAEAEDEEASASSSQSGVDIILRHRLQETGFALKDYKTYLKDYVKKIVEHLEKENPDRVQGFKESMKAAFPKICAKERFKEFQFYTGESRDPDGMTCLVEWDGETPYVYFFKDGCVAEKF